MSSQRQRRRQRDGLLTVRTCTSSSHAESELHSLPPTDEQYLACCGWLRWEWPRERSGLPIVDQALGHFCFSTQILRGDHLFNRRHWLLLAVDGRFGSC